MLVFHVFQQQRIKKLLSKGFRRLEFLDICSRVTDSSIISGFEENQNNLAFETSQLLYNIPNKKLSASVFLSNIC